MSWKDIGKSSYNIQVGKFPHWKPKEPYAVPWEGNKPIYNIGDDLAYATSPVFDTDFTNIPYGFEHQPCGYWWRDYRGPYIGIFTSLLYPVLPMDEMEGEVSLIAGEFSTVFIKYEYGEDMETTLMTLSEGEFKTVFQRYEWEEGMETTLVDLSEGEFKTVFHRYTIPTESIESTSVSMTAGKHWVVIKYENWPVEAIESTSVTFTGGVHETND